MHTPHIHPVDCLPSHRVASVLIALLLVGGSLPAAGGAAATTTTPAGVETNTTDRETADLPNEWPAWVRAQAVSKRPNGVPLSVALALWSRDADTRGTGPSSVALYEVLRDARSEVSPELAEEVNETLRNYRTRDTIYTRPRRGTTVWTRNGHRSLERAAKEVGLGAENFSLVPERATPTDGLAVRDAHITLHAVTPQTVVHDSDEVYRAIPPSGQVRALTDYRVERPEQVVDQNPPGENVTRRVTSYEVVSHNLSETWLTIGGERHGNASSSYTPVFNYTLGAEEAPSQVTVHARVNATVNKTVVTTREVRIPVNESSNRGNRTAEIGTTEYQTVTRKTREVTTLNNVHTVHDSVAVDVYRLGELTTIRAHIPANSAAAQGTMTSLGVGTSTPWSGYAVLKPDSRGDGLAKDRVTTQWRFYPTERTGWETMAFRGTNKSHTTVTPALFRPTTLHAVHIPDSLTGAPAPNSGGPAAIRQRGIDRGTSIGVHPNVTATNYLGPATEARTILARHAGTINGSANNPVRVYGLVYGVNATRGVDTFTRYHLRRANLTVTVQEHEGPVSTVQVRLADHKTGRPIPLQRSPGRLLPTRSDDRFRRVARSSGRPVMEMFEQNSIPRPLWQKVRVQNQTDDRPAVYVLAENTDTLVVVPTSDLADDGIATVQVRAGSGQFYAAFFPQAWTNVPEGEAAYLPASSTDYVFSLGGPKDWVAGFATLVAWVLPIWVAWKLTEYLARLLRTIGGGSR